MTGNSRDGVTSLGHALLDFVANVDALGTPADVLNGLHAITSRHCNINVLAALRFPIRAGDADSLLLGETVFLHEGVNVEWWKEYLELIRLAPPPGYALAQLSLGPFTNTEMMRAMEPLAIERWSVDLAHKYGMRDGFVCPVGGRWVLAFWSKTPLEDRFSPELRAMVFMGATFAAIRIQKLAGLRTGARRNSTASLTPRECTVLRLLSVGNTTRQVAEALSLGEETVRTHLKKAQVKLKVRSRIHAVAQAVRLRLIP